MSDHKYFDGRDYHSDPERMARSAPDEAAVQMVHLRADLNAVAASVKASLRHQSQRIERLEQAIAQQASTLQRMNQLLAMVEKIMRANNGTSA